MNFVIANGEPMHPATELALAVVTALRLAESEAKPIGGAMDRKAWLLEVGPVRLLQIAGDASNSPRIDAFYIEGGDADEDSEERFGSSDRLFSVRPDEPPRVEVFKPVSEWRQDVMACLLAKIAVEQDRLDKADGAPTMLQ
jgi:hypothetical protein